jgi:hypothetical protein
LKILFETKPMLEDSVTYDITSWCVPLAFGVKTYGVKERLDAKPAIDQSAIGNQPSPASLMRIWQRGSRRKMRSFWRLLPSKKYA